MTDPNKYGTWQEGIFAQHKPKQTNADRIRAMTDEELADWVWGAESAGRAYGPRGKNAWLKWLRQEVNSNEGSDNLNA